MTPEQNIPPKPFQPEFRRLLDAYATDVELRVMSSAGEIGPQPSVSERVRTALRSGVPLEHALHQIIQTTVYNAIQQLTSPAGRRLLETMNIVPLVDTLNADAGKAKIIFPEATPETLFPLPPDTSYIKPGGWTPGL